MLHFGQQDGVAGFEVFRAPGVGQQVDAFGCAARKNDFRGLAGMDEAGRRGRGPPSKATVARRLNS